MNEISNAKDRRMTKADYPVKGWWLLLKQWLAAPPPPPANGAPPPTRPHRATTFFELP